MLAVELIQHDILALLLGIYSFPLLSSSEANGTGPLTEDPALHRRGKRKEHNNTHLAPNKFLLRKQFVKYKKC